MKSCKGLFLVLLLLWPLGALAQDLLLPGRSYRALAMGNTGIASANDSYALFYNPAMLANVRSWWIDYAAWTLEASPGFQAADILPVFAQIQPPYLKTEGLPESQRSSFLEKDHPYLRGAAGINLVASLSDKGFGLGANYLQEVIITTDADQAVLQQRYDRISQAGVSLPLGVGQWVVGFTGRSVVRQEATSDVADEVPGWGDPVQGSATDVGLLFRASGSARFSLGLLVQNAGGMDLGSTKDAEPQEVSLGMAMWLDAGLFSIMPTVDVRGVSTTRARKNRVHAGIEFGLFPYESSGNIISLRAGSNEGYPSSGAELNFFDHAMIIGYASFGEEVGPEDSPYKSQRQVAYLSLGW